MSDITLNTNLASEYYVLSMLYRLGINSYLTLGNKKSVDIIVDKKGKILTIDVKGLKGKSNFPINKDFLIAENHFFVFVSFLDQINNPSCIPEVYVVPSADLNKKWKETGNKSLVTKFANRYGVELKNLRKVRRNFRDKWSHIN